jgi:hypothetical protein
VELAPNSPPPPWILEGSEPVRTRVGRIEPDRQTGQARPNPELQKERE